MNSRDLMTLAIQIDSMNKQLKHEATDMQNRNRILDALLLGMQLGQKSGQFETVFRFLYSLNQKVKVLDMNLLEKFQHILDLVENNQIGQFAQSQIIDINSFNDFLELQKKEIDPLLDAIKQTKLILEKKAQPNIYQKQSNSQIQQQNQANLQLQQSQIQQPSQPVQLSQMSQAQLEKDKQLEQQKKQNQERAQQQQQQQQQQQNQERGKQQQQQQQQSQVKQQQQPQLQQQQYQQSQQQQFQLLSQQIAEQQHQNSKLIEKQNQNQQQNVNQIKQQKAKIKQFQITDEQKVILFLVQEEYNSKIYGQFMQQIECNICMDQMTEKSIFRLRDCLHFFHKDCLVKHGEQQNDYPLKCPQQNCKEISHEDYLKLFNQNQRQKFDEISFKKFIMKNGQKYFDCNCGLTIALEGSEEVIYCQQCDKWYCRKCRKDMHDEDCGEDQFRFLAQKEHYSQCLKCSHWVEKAYGCNHIKCICGHEFCYNCRKEWVKDQECKCIEERPQFSLERLLQFSQLQQQQQQLLRNAPQQ